jgi:uncharacterized membrane protein YhaH (DUF805 family)
LRCLGFRAYLTRQGIEAMAFGEKRSGEWLLLRTIRGTFDLSGRSRRTEVAQWWFATMLLTLLGEHAATWAASAQAGRMASAVLSLLLIVPFFALLVRRLHDQDRSGWWAVALPLVVAICLPKVIASASGDVEAQLSAEPHGVLAVVGVLCLLAIFAFCVAPETIGPNRFGPDPREDKQESGRAAGSAA